MNINIYWEVIESLKKNGISELCNIFKELSYVDVICFDVISNHYLKLLVLARVDLGLQCISPGEVSDGFLIDACSTIIVSGRDELEKVLINLDYLVEYNNKHRLDLEPDFLVFDLGVGFVEANVNESDFQCLLNNFFSEYTLNNMRHSIWHFIQNIGYNGLIVSNFNKEFKSMYPNLWKFRMAQVDKSKNYPTIHLDSKTSLDDLMDL